MIRIRKGLDLPIAGEPDQIVHEGPAVSSVGLVADDFVGMKPTLEVAEGDRVKLGQLLFTDKKNAGVRYTSPGAGIVASINRGEKRKFLSLVIDLDGEDEETFPSFPDADLTTLSRDQVRDTFVQSGLWTAFRTRPYSKVPAVDAAPRSIFITAMDTNPLAAAPEPIIVESERDFIFGLQVIRHLTDGKVFFCKRPGERLPGEDLGFLSVEEFEGPHPAGLPGTHIHFLDPVGETKTVWYIGYQDVIAAGRLFVTGRLPVTRIVSLAGPAVRKPRLIRTRLGANLSDLTRDQLQLGENRVISGSVLSGRAAGPPTDFLGRYQLLVSSLREGGEREFLGWQRPGLNKFSIKRVFASAFTGMNRRFAFTTSLEGSPRAMVPIGMYEDVMPLDIIPTYLLRALIVGDNEQARALGCLELDEEDLALCTFVCPGKTEYGPLLRRGLETIEREG
ncbi:MAG: Na(+)-translocating NADH-quinone reductase subunit A [Planctomycetaceae bacterium]